MLCTLSDGKTQGKKVDLSLRLCRVAKYTVHQLLGRTEPLRQKPG